MSELTELQQRILEYLAARPSPSGVSSADLARILKYYGSEQDVCGAVDALHCGGLVIAHTNMHAAYPRYDLIVITAGGRARTSDANAVR